MTHDALAPGFYVPHSILVGDTRHTLRFPFYLALRVEDASRYALDPILDIRTRLVRITWENENRCRRCEMIEFADGDIETGVSMTSREINTVEALNLSRDHDRLWTPATYADWTRLRLAAARWAERMRP